MALRRLPRENLSASMQELLDTSLAVAGDAHFLEVGANAPHMLDWYFNSFYGQIFFGGIAPVRIKELVRLRLSTLHGCAY
ncbi:MAG: hypothetical protein FJ147_17375 [Deltaproteobacteria bacterium]|nr:hypothetical protein [Deltaproteobacteria bacterium]